MIARQDHEMMVDKLHISKIQEHILKQDHDDASAENNSYFNDADKHELRAEVRT
jgi:hypothetical protein